MRSFAQVRMSQRNTEKILLLNICKKKLGVCRIRDVNKVSDKEFLRNFMQMHSLMMLNGISYSDIGSNREEFEFLEARANLKANKPQPQNPHQD